MQARIEWQGKVQFRAESGTGHTVLLDGPPEAGGENRGCRPMELVLMGLGGCTSYDVVTILAKSRQNVHSCVTELTAERAETTPQVFTHINIHFIVSGTGLDERKVARAVELSAEKYCSASIMLERGGVRITHSHAIIEVAS
jgi:putative redox protein